MSIDVAIIASVIPARYKLLERALETWQSSAAASGLSCGICLYFEDWHTQVDVPRFPAESGALYKIAISSARSGSHIAGYNYWLERTAAKVYLFTHPDLLFPVNTVRVAYEQAQPNTYVAFKCFWLSPDFTRDLDKFNWRHPETLEKEPMLFELDELLKGSFYANRTARQIKTWESTTTFAVDAETLARFAPFENFGEQGPDDPYLAEVRRRLGIKNHTVQDPMLFHQWHENSWFGTGEDAVKKAMEAADRRFSLNE